MYAYKRYIHTFGSAFQVEAAKNTKILYFSYKDLAINVACPPYFPVFGLHGNYLAFIIVSTYTEIHKYTERIKSALIP